MLKQYLRNIVPLNLQVPIKYYFNALRGQLESELQILPRLVKPGERVIDVGGNRGIYAYALWRLSAIVEVFEPNPVCANVIKAWSKGRQSVSLHQVALSNMAGVADLHIPVDISGIEHDASASLEHADFVSMRNEQVHLRTLDSFDFDNVSFIKIDVEGHEFNVLLGSENLLRMQRPSVLVEIEQRHCQRPVNEIFNLMADWGFLGYFLDSGCLRPLTFFDVSRDQRLEDFGAHKGRYINNFLFLHQDGLKNGDFSSLNLDCVVG